MARKPIVIEKAFLLKFTAAVGQPKAAVTLCADLSMKTARALGIFNEIYAGDKAPRTKLKKTELEIEFGRVDLKLEVIDVKTPLELKGCSAATRFIAVRKGSVEKGKPISLMLHWTLKYEGQLLDFMRWQELYGRAVGTATMTFNTAEQDTLPLKAEKKSKKKAEKPKPSPKVKRDPMPTVVGEGEGDALGDPVVVM